MAESEEELKSLLMKVKEDSEKAGLKLNIQKMKIMASGPITSWEIDGETVKTVSDFIFLVIAAMKLKDAYSLEGKLLVQRDFLSWTIWELVANTMFRHPWRGYFLQTRTFSYISMLILSKAGFSTGALIHYQPLLLRFHSSFR